MVYEFHSVTQINSFGIIWEDLVSNCHGRFKTLQSLSKNTLMKFYCFTRKRQLLLCSWSKKTHIQYSLFYAFINIQFLWNSYFSTCSFHYCCWCCCFYLQQHLRTSIPHPDLIISNKTTANRVYHKVIDIKASVFIRGIYIHFLRRVRKDSLTFSKRAVFNSACSVSLWFFFCSKDSFNSLSFPWRFCSLFSLSFRRLWISSTCALAESRSIDNCLEIYIQKY